MRHSAEGKGNIQAKVAVKVTSSGFGGTAKDRTIRKDKILLRFKGFGEPRIDEEISEVRDKNHKR